MKNEKNLLLGKKTNYKKHYSQTILHKIKRSDKLNLKNFYGKDIWNCYDFMFLNEDEIPLVGILTIEIPCESIYIIESKSMKLYLGSFYNRIFKDVDDVLVTLKKDLEVVLKADIHLYINLNVNENVKFKKIKSSCLEKDDEEIFESNGIQYCHTNSFRSLCPVTGQPDFASIFFEYESGKIKKDNLRKYIYSFSEKSGFHEECIEEIYNHLKKKYDLHHLVVNGNFNRRGGIDINPIRYSHKQYTAKFVRQLRQ